MAVNNDPKTIAKLLRAIAGGTMARVSGHDIIFSAAADLLDPPAACGCNPGLFCTCGLRYRRDLANTTTVQSGE